MSIRDAIIDAIFHKATACVLDGDRVLYATESDEPGFNVEFWDNGDMIVAFTETNLINATIDCHGLIVLKGHREYDADYQETFSILPLRPMSLYEYNYNS